MEVTLRAMPPYLPSLRWMQQGSDSAGMPAREYSRTLVESNSSYGMVLTVPLAGGASVAKRLAPERLEISGHGDWTRIHLGAIEAAYGRDPYFHHFFPGIAEIISKYPPMLADLNRTLLTAMLADINFEENIKDMAGMRKTHPGRYADIRQRMERKVNPDHSMVEPLFRLGPDILFLLSSPLTHNL